MNAFGELVSWKKYRKTIYQQFSWKEALEKAWKTAMEPQKASEEN
jgi:phosphopantetheinyl transferase (holo-ACP synthase)